jgi:D-alanyl-D-alanine carboxypeptidase
MSLDDRVRLASITKMMTYAAIMELVKKQRLRLEERAIDLLPAGTLDGIPCNDEITVAHLLEHKSGLHNFNGENSSDFFKDLFEDSKWGTRRWTASELLAYARNPEHKPTGRPGERTSYSSTGYIVLEMILEHLEKKSFPEVYRELLFGPLDMRFTGVEGADFGADQIANSYARPDSGDAVRRSPFAGRNKVRSDGLINLSKGLAHYNAWARGAGAIASNVQDLAKFMDALTTGRITVLKDQEAEFARSKAKPAAYFDWNGGARGIQATILFAPREETTVIVLSNASNAGPGSHDTAKQLLTAARGKAQELQP